MLGNLMSVVSLVALLCYLYGVLLTIQDTKKNECKMTYMYEYPQFVKIHVPETEQYPKYNLFAYSEGRHTENARNMKFTGAPVIFVHGNAGSYKQVRSLASVALRKAIDLNWAQHLDYFTVDFNEEYLALFGGFLEDQAAYLSHSIQTVLQLYQNLANPPTSVVIVTHSMGGKTIQASLISSHISKAVNTIIMLAAPVDRPVINVDVYFESFYRKIDDFWLANRRETATPNNETNKCCRNELYVTSSRDSSDGKRVGHKPHQLLNDLLLVTIGGGEQDLLVHAGLTNSKFSDVHTMSTAMPNVWLSTDHLASVWCLQQVIVINRFLYNIIAPSKSRRDTGQYFLAGKTPKLELAQKHFTPYHTNKPGVEVKLVQELDNIGEWVEDSRRAFNLDFPGGFPTTRYQMIRLTDAPQTQMLHVEAVNLDSSEWLFGCGAVENFNQSRFCTNAIPLNEFVERIPSNDASVRMVSSLDLHKIKAKFPRWTHVLVRTPATNQKFELHVDIHGAERDIHIKMPKWYMFTWFDILGETVSGSSALHLKIAGLDESYQSVELQLETVRCARESYHVMAKVCVPWAHGFERYQHLTGKSNGHPLLIYAPSSKPTGYNTTSNPISVEFYLDPSCTYKIQARSSFSVTVSRIVQQFSHWMPAHLVAILLLSIKHQLNISPKGEPFKCGTLYSGLLNSSSFFIITASRVFIKMILWTNVLPAPDAYEHSMLISVVIHGSSLALLMLFTSILWMAVRFCADVANYACDKVCPSKTQPQASSSSSAIWSVVVNFPTAIGIVVISIMLTSCGGVALILALGIYFCALIKMQINSLRIDTPLVSTENTTETTSLGSDINETNTEEEVDPIENDDDKDENNKQNVKNVESTSTYEPDSGDAAECETNDDEIPSTNELDNALELTEEEKLSDAELNQLIKETLARRKDPKLLTPNSDEAQKRVEYDAINANANSVNFHLSMFTSLVLLTLLNLPSVLAWVKNYEYSHALTHDPSFIPAVIALIALSVVWQLNAPRDIAGYSTLGTVCYLLAVVCVLYCQDSMYRLNAIIATAFIFMAIHQLITRNALRPDRDGPPTDTKRLTPEQIEAAMAEIMKMEPIDEAADQATEEHLRAI